MLACIGLLVHLWKDQPVPLSLTHRLRSWTSQLCFLAMCESSSCRWDCSLTVDGWECSAQWLGLGSSPSPLLCCRKLCGLCRMFELDSTPDILKTQLNPSDLCRSVIGGGGEEARVINILLGLPLVCSWLTRLPGSSAPSRRKWVKRPNLPKRSLTKTQLWGELGCVLELHVNVVPFSVTTVRGRYSGVRCLQWLTWFCPVGLFC